MVLYLSDAIQNTHVWLHFKTNHIGWLISRNGDFLFLEQRNRLRIRSDTPVCLDFPLVVFQVFCQYISFLCVFLCDVDLSLTDKLCTIDPMAGVLPPSIYVVPLELYPVSYQKSPVLIILSRT